MKYRVDTDWVADYLKGRQQAISLFSAAGPEGLTISLIAATAIHYSLTLLTRNTKDLRRVPGLQRYDDARDGSPLPNRLARKG